MKNFILFQQKDHNDLIEIYEVLQKRKNNKIKINLQMKILKFGKKTDLNKFVKNQDRKYENINTDKQKEIDRK